MRKWYQDGDLVRALPRRYQAYAYWSRLAGDPASRRVPAGSFLLRSIRGLSRLAGLDTVAQVRGIDRLTVLADFADERILEVVHEIRGENPEYAMMRAILCKGDTFIDVGANFGTFSLLASRRVGPEGKVIAIEPQPRLAGLIRKSVELSEVANARVIEAAIGSAPGVVTLLVPSNDTGRAGIFPAFSGKGSHEGVQREVLTLDSLAAEIPRGGRVFMKIDVEGSELAVLDGATEIVSTRKPVILVELNPWSARAAGRTTSDLLDKLDNLGYRSFSTTTSFPKHLQRSEIPLDRQTNLLATM